MVDESLELRFNCACALADLGRVEEALKELDHVIQDCSQSSSDEGKSLEDAQRELQDILTMRAYVLQRMGKKDEALALYTKVLQSSTASKDSAFIAVAANNIVSMRRADEKLFDSQKKLSRATRISCDILTNSQRHSILANQALLSFYAKQNQQCLGLIHKLLDVFPANEFSHLLLSILAFQDTSNEKAMEEFGNLDSLTVKLAKAYFIILRGDLKAGANALRDIKEICYRPGILSTVISLYDRLNDIPSALDLFSSAIDHYSPFPDQVGMVLNLLSKAALFKASKGLHNECLNDLKQALSLRSLNSSADISQETLINFVVSASYTDSSLAAQFAADLPPLADVEFVDFMSLENSLTFPLDFIRKRKLKKDDFAISTEPNQEIKKNEDLEGTISEKQNKKKKKKAVRYPKGYDPTNPGPPPDPERWLPRWQRSTSKKGASRRKRDQQIVRGPQGASIGLSKPQSAASQVPGEELNSAPALAKGTQVKRGNKKKKPGNKGW